MAKYGKVWERITKVEHRFKREDHAIMQYTVYSVSRGAVAACMGAST